uniref:TLC domain containing 4a n=1 Tax=Callorhinchus milii TaxID=7868 RepID=A0A4W3H5F6_CALMI
MASLGWPFVMVFSFIVFQGLFHFLSARISMLCCKGFRTLTDLQKTEWNSRIVSTFHALVVGILCLYLLWVDDAVNADPVWGDPSLVKLNVGLTAGYLISDLLLILWYWKAIGDKYFVIHHLTALCAYYYVLILSGTQLLQSPPCPILSRKIDASSLLPTLFTQHM